MEVLEIVTRMYSEDYLFRKQSGLANKDGSWLMIRTDTIKMLTMLTTRWSKLLKNWA